MRSDMYEVSRNRHGRPAHHWRRDLVELAALFAAVAVADAVANLVGHGPDGPAVLVGSAAALAATAGFHTWWARRHGHPPSPPGPGAPGDAPGRPRGHGGAEGTGTLWRLRTTVRDEPGSLAALSGALAGLGVDILSLQTHPLPSGTVDEFLLRAPGAVTASEISRTVAAAGGRDSWTERVDAHDLVDAPTRVIALATRTALDPAELPLALRGLLGRCTVRSLPAPDAVEVPPEGRLDGTVLRLRAPDGGTITVERPHLPFTPAEFARARALVELDARLGPRLPHGHDVVALPKGSAVTLRRAGQGDLEAARALHARCSERTLRQRYHGPVQDADRYLDHLLSPRFGRTLAAQTPSGRIVALGHLLWDGDETEAALLVEDDWQGRGIGGELLRRLVATAADEGAEGVYAVTHVSNTAMVSAMRGLGLPLDYQVEEGTLVVTARLDGASVAPGGGTQGEGPATPPAG
ncbi:GNAT family N-acetyltransferase [Streptomyces sp. NPDC050560]|uniref:GNAT family N-acetyltransferase n=1 Tax=Streptomyces sp. NPDC050560 TaxID=3365630 RepID=UPI0037B3869E